METPLDTRLHFVYIGDFVNNSRLEAKTRWRYYQISLALLLGSDGHFGNGRSSNMTSKHLKDDPTNNVLLTKGSEAPILVEKAIQKFNLIRLSAMSTIRGSFNISSKGQKSNKIYYLAETY